ncbi:hypothetical protein [Streptomyces sp. NPDC001970]
MRSAARYSSSVESGSPLWAATVWSFQAGGCGSHGSAAASAGLKPNGASSPSHGSGTRQPSRPGS